MINRLRIVFAGTPDFAAHHLESLLKDNLHDVVAVYTQPDRPSGRGRKLTPSPVKALAQRYALPIYQPQNLKEADTQQQLAAHNADIMVVVAYGLLLPEVVLNIPRLGCINVHASLLPRWRGAAPIQRAIEAGDAESGVTIMQMDAGLDTGDMLVKATTLIDKVDSAADLQDKLAQLGPPTLLKALGQLAEGTAKPEPQGHRLATYAAKLSKEEALIDWSQPAKVIDRKVRAFNPFPVASVDLNGQRIRIWAAHLTESNGEPGAILRVDASGVLVACGNGGLLLTEVQLPGKKRLPVADVLRGNTSLFTVGSRFQ